MLWSHLDHLGLCPWAVSLNPRKGSTITRETHDQSPRSTGIEWSWLLFINLERMGQFVYIVGDHVSMNRKIMTTSIYLPIKRALNVLITVPTKHTELINFSEIYLLMSIWISRAATSCCSQPLQRNPTAPLSLYAYASAKHRSCLRLDAQRLDGQLHGRQ